mgnify:CR=1 FL=1
MRNLLKYPPLEWRKRALHCVPSGPDLSGAPLLTIHVAGSRLRFKAPRHSPRRREVSQKHYHPKLDLLRDPYGHGMSVFAPGLMANDDWGYANGVKRDWAFWGPWMTGCKAELTFSVLVMGRVKGKEFSGLSLFHPKAFEMVLVQFLNERYGHEGNLVGGQLPETAPWHGPMNWQRHKHLPVFSASFDIFPRGPDLPGATEAEKLNLRHTPRHLFVFPITDQHFVQVWFEQQWYSTDDEGKPLFDPSPVQALQDEILKSFTLELSAEAQASYDKVKSACRDMQLSKGFAPLKWPTQSDGVDSGFGGDGTAEARLSLGGGL